MYKYPIFTADINALDNIQLIYQSTHTHNFTAFNIENISNFLCTVGLTHVVCKYIQYFKPMQNTDILKSEAQMWCFPYLEFYLAQVTVNRAKHPTKHTDTPQKRSKSKSTDQYFW